MSPGDLIIQQKQLKEYLDADWVESCESEYNSPSLLVNKPDGSKRWCQDGRGLNDITVKNKVWLPDAGQLFDYIVGSKCLSKIDLRKGFHQVRLRETDRHKTAFCTPQGHFQWKVMSMGLCNAPATFQTMMQDILKDRLYSSVLVFVDDILIYSKSEEEHQEHLEWVLGKLREHTLYASLEKCEFFKEKLIFLGHMVSGQGVTPIADKVKAILEWPELTSVKEVRSFLGLSGYYRRFVKDYAKIAAPLTELTKEGNQRHWEWGEPQRKAFQELKVALSGSPVLILADMDKPFQVTTDASGFAVGGVLSQADRDGVQQPVAYYSHKLLPAERNYPVHEQELLAVFMALKHWRYYLHGGPHPVTVVTDHQSLKFINTQPILTGRQARWVEFLQDFELIISYRPGTQNGAADALSRRGDHEREAVAEDKEKKLIPSKDRSRLNYSLASITSIHQSQLIEDIRSATHESIVGQMMMKDPEGYGMTLTDGILYNPQDCIYVPEEGALRTRILREVHDAPTGGHLGIEKTMVRLGRLCWWPGMRKDVQQYVLSCVPCQSNKSSNQLPAGKLQPLPIPTRRWEQVSMDFVGPLRVTKRDNDFILVVVDKLSKMAHFLPCRTTITAPQVAGLFMREVVRHHGMPSSIVSDRDPRFTSHFWNELWTLLGTSLNMSTARHPETDGQTERMNRVLEEMLRAYVSKVGDDWDEHLSTAEIAFNSSKHASTGFTPYYLNTGAEVYLPIDQALSSVAQSSNPTAAECVKQLSLDLDTAKENIKKAQERQAKYADKKRRAIKEYEIGDKVMLSTEGMASKSGKLLSKFIGPFEVIGVPTVVNVRLALPAQLLKSRTHDVFHVSKVKSFISNDGKFATREQLDRPLPDIIDGDEYFEVESIMAKRRIKKGKRSIIQYLVKWKGFDVSECTWQTNEDLENVKDMVSDYERQAVIKEDQEQ
jgi:hypothetical protein